MYIVEIFIVHSGGKNFVAFDELFGVKLVWIAY